MKKNMMRLLSVLLCAVLLIAALPAASVQAEEQTSAPAAPALDSIETDEEGNYLFETFAELKELVALDAEQYVYSAVYTGTGPLVIEENLNLSINFTALCVSEMVIPEGVTLNSSSYQIKVDTLTVNGTLDVADLYVYQSMTVNGTVYVRAEAYLVNGAEVTGREHVVFPIEELSFNCHYYPENMAQLKTALQDAAAAYDPAATTDIDTYMVYIEDILIDESIVVPGNCVLMVMSQSGTTLAAGCTLENNCIIGVSGPFYVNGTIVNNASREIILTSALEGYAHGAMAFQPGSSYSGEGSLSVAKEGVGALEEVLPGLDLSPFQISDMNNSWVLRIAPATNLVAMYSVFNPDSLEHMFAMEGELAALEATGWVTVGISFYSATEGIPVYRLFNPTNYSHYYCINEQERANLIAGGWLEDGILCFTQEGGIPLYDLFNPNTYLHYYTAMRDEIGRLVSEGWIEVGLAWFAAEP